MFDPISWQRDGENELRPLFSSPLLLIILMGTVVLATSLAVGDDKPPPSKPSPTAPRPGEQRPKIAKSELEKQERIDFLSQCQKQDRVYKQMVKSNPH